MDIKLVSKYLLGILLFSLAIVAQAAPDLIVSAVSGSPSESVTVPVAFTNNATGDVVAMDFRLDYDPAVLTLTSVDYSALGGNISNHNNDAVNGIITFLIATNPLQPISNGNLLVTFTIDAGAAIASTTALNIQNVTFSNNAAGSVAPDNIVNANVAIVAVVAVPTLSQWGIILLSLMLLLIASSTSRLRQ